jgi:hypothetical protein
MPEDRNFNPRTDRFFWLAVILAVAVFLISEFLEDPPFGEGLIAPNATAEAPRETGEAPRETGDGDAPPGLTYLGKIETPGYGLGKYITHYITYNYRYRDGANVCYLAHATGIGVSLTCFKDPPPPE